MNNGLPTDNLLGNAAKALHSWIISGARIIYSWGYALLVLALTLPRQHPCPIMVIMFSSGTPWNLSSSEEVSAGIDPVPGAWCPSWPHCRSCVRVHPLKEFNCITLMTESFIFLPYFSSEILERNSTDQTKRMYCLSAANKLILGVAG